MLEKIARLYTEASRELGISPAALRADVAICVAALIVSVGAAAFAILLGGPQS
jgi:hypothetical protein